MNILYIYCFELWCFMIVIIIHSLIILLFLATFYSLVIARYSDISVDHNDCNAGFFITFRKNKILHCKKQWYLDKNDNNDNKFSCYISNVFIQLPKLWPLISPFLQQWTCIIIRLTRRDVFEIRPCQIVNMYINRYIYHYKIDTTICWHHVLGYY
jgi:hypothetical protein